MLISRIIEFWLSCVDPLVLLLSQILKLFGFLIFWHSVYPMKVIPEPRYAHKIWYLRLYLKRIGTLYLQNGEILQ
jgi:hypothetical protein